MKHTNNSRSEEGVASPQTASIVDYLRALRKEVVEEIDYIVEIEGYEIPQVWRDKIVQPIDFEIAHQALEAEKATPPIKQNPSSGESKAKETQL